jgi:hypothetical protein
LLQSLPHQRLISCNYRFRGLSVGLLLNKRTQKHNMLTLMLSAPLLLHDTHGMLLQDMLTLHMLADVADQAMSLDAMAASVQVQGYLPQQVGKWVSNFKS